MVLYKLAEKRFARSVRVKVGGVDEITARLAEKIVQLPRFVLPRTPAPFLAEGHRAKRRLRNSKSAVAQNSVSHKNLLFSRRSLACAAHVNEAMSITWANELANSGIDSTSCHAQPAFEAPVLKNGCNGQMAPFLGLARTRSFRLLHPLLRIDAEDQP
jgi:hypothetical protein